MQTPQKKTLIIAEAGVNHNGSLERALEMVDAAAVAGADVVKFQSFKAKNLVSRSAPQAEYQRKNTGVDQSQLEMIQRLELSEAAHFTLQERAREKRIEFLSSPFDLESLEFLAKKVRLPLLKIPSGEITNLPLLLAAGGSGCRLILSTGMSTLQEIEEALGALAYGFIHGPLVKSFPVSQGFREAFLSESGKKALRERLTLLHCTTEYPSPIEEVNLKAMDSLAAHFDVPVGLSDHTLGIMVPIAAVARGAKIIEKHFTLDRRLPGPDHVASLEPAELAAMAAGIRQVELAIGDGHKGPTPSELKNMPIARKSLTAACAIKKGETFTPSNLTAKRPGSGISPAQFWNYLGRTAERDYQADELIV